MATNVSAVSARKIEANRRNSAKSTGPKTAEGKARSAENAVVLHGFYSSKLLLAGEDSGELDALRDELMRDLRPQGAAERLIVERLTAAHWKLRRLLEAEQRMLDHQLGQLRKHAKPADATPAAALSEMVYGGAELDRISIYERRLEGSIHRCHRELRQMRKDREQQSEDLATASAPLGGEGGGEERPLVTSNEYRVNMRSDAQDSCDTRQSSPTAALTPHPDPLPQGERGPCGIQNVRGEATGEGEEGKSSKAKGKREEELRPL